jgi:hypothetical protein
MAAKKRKAPTPSGKIPPQAHAALNVIKAVGGTASARTIFEHPSFRAERKTMASLARMLAVLGANGLVKRDRKTYTLTAKAQEQGLAPPDPAAVVPDAPRKYRPRSTRAVAAAEGMTLHLKLGSQVTVTVGGQSLTVCCN